MIGRDRGKTSRLLLGTQTVIQSVQKNRWQFRCLKKLAKTSLENGARFADFVWVSEKASLMIAAPPPWQCPANSLLQCQQRYGLLAEIESLLVDLCMPKLLERTNAVADYVRSLWSVNAND